MKNDLPQIIRPLIESSSSLREHRMALHEMFALAVSNIPENETENFTARKLTPTYLVLCEFFENLQET